MPFLDHVLQPPAYGWKDEQGNLVKPGINQILSEFFSRLNVFKDKKNWLPFFSWLKVVCLMPFFFIFVFNYLTWWTLLAAFVYSMIIMGTHGTIWLHRFCTHGAYTFKNKFWRFFTQNLTISVVPEEIYVISHHVHHAKSDTPGDPYNPQAGFLYCFLADAIHQPIAKDLSESDYNKVKNLMKKSGIKGNTYAQYQRWGSYVNPSTAILSTVLNWSFWYLAFYLIGGNALACSIFGSACFWAIGVRTFNYEGHGKGENKQREGTDFSVNDQSINQLWPGIVAGEWHNNHHLFPKSARSGFQPHQVDLAWYYIKMMSVLGPVTHYRDSKKEFYEQYHLPYLLQKKQEAALALITVKVPVKNVSSIIEPTL